MKKIIKITFNRGRVCAAFHKYKCAYHFNLSLEKLFWFLLMCTNVNSSSIVSSNSNNSYLYVCAIAQKLIIK